MKLPEYNYHFFNVYRTESEQLGVTRKDGKPFLTTTFDGIRLYDSQYPTEAAELLAIMRMLIEEYEKRQRANNTIQYGDDNAVAFQFIPKNEVG